MGQQAVAKSLTRLRVHLTMHFIHAEMYPGITISPVIFYPDQPSQYWLNGAVDLLSFRKVPVYVLSMQRLVLKNVILYGVWLV
jgi:hypothetical protein